jgi:glycosyltransferase involved in cell wall biosynthesis
MINVLHLINITGGGGTESYIYSLAKKLHNNKCKFFLAYSKEGPSLNLFKDLGIETIKLPMDNPYDFKAAKQLKKICADKSIDVIHTHFLRENYISIISKVLGNKVKLINTRHMLIKNSKSVAYSNRFMTKFNYKVIAVSKAVEELLIDEGISPNKVQLIYTGINLDNWSSEKNLEFRNEFNIDKDEILIASVARFSEEKGHEFLINSIAAMRQTMKSRGISDLKFKFILAGDGNLLNKTRELAQTLGIDSDIIFTGHRNDINHILRACDLFISHSKSEAFGISILEALASGLPVISTDSGGSREIITPNCDFGILIPYGDEEKLVESMLKFLLNKNLIETYRTNGLNFLSENFNLDNTMEETYNLYS